MTTSVYSQLECWECLSYTCESIAAFGAPVVPAWAVRHLCIGWNNGASCKHTRSELVIDDVARADQGFLGRQVGFCQLAGLASAEEFFERGSGCTVL